MNLSAEIPCILIVDDKPMNLLSMSAAIQDDSLEIIQASSGNEALRMILDREFALILLDVQMPDMDGFETAELIRSNPKSRHIPIIFVSAINKEERHLFKGYDSGAVDYLFKPLDIQILKSKIKVFIDLYIQKKKSEILNFQLKQALSDAETSRKIVEEQNLLLKELAIKDGLTGLYNYRHMQVIMESEFNRAIRYKSELSCLLMDIDFFKEVNDTLGHPFGDFVLKEFATCLKEHMRYSDFLFRYGGEEFLVLLPQTDLEGAKFTAEKFRTAIESRPFRDGNRHTVVTVSIGVASLYVNHPVTYSEMISFADQALFMAKIQGRNRVIVYQDTLPLKDHGNVSSEKTLQALKDKLSIVFLKIKKAAVSSLELLARDSDIPLSDRKKRLLNEYITMMGYHMSLSPSLVETFKLSTVILECIHDLIQSLCEGPDDSLNNEVKNSPLVIAGLIESLDVFSNERNILAARHEHFDGSGTPLGLKNDQIPLGARIIAIVSIFVDRVASHEANETSYDKALMDLSEEAGKTLDPELLIHFFDALELCEPNKIPKMTFDTARKRIRALNPGMTPE